MRIKIIILFLLISVFINAENYRTIYFKGDFVLDEESGLSILPDENKEIIAITNMIYHYALILPYSTDWVIVFDDKYVLSASNNLLNVTLELIKNNGESSESFLENLMNRYLDNKLKFGISNAIIINYENDHVLATIIDIYLLDDKIKDKDIKQIDYFSTKTFKDERFIMHLSFTQKQDHVDLNNPDLLNYLTIGFNIDF
jgi:hypothetical protein